MTLTGDALTLGRMAQKHAQKLPDGWRPVDSIATRVKLVRDRLGVSQREFALLTGLTYGEVQSLENGAAARHEVDKVAKIAKATGVDREWLLWGGPLVSLTTGGKSVDSPGPMLMAA